MTSFGYRLNPRYAIKECLSCGALYTGDFCCSKRNDEDKILVPKLPKNCVRSAKCGHPVNGPYCQGCTLLREKLEEDLVTYFQNFQNTSESSDDNGIFCQQCTCKSCRKGAHIGYNRPPKVPIISNPEPFNQTMNDELPQTFPGFDPTCYSDKENSVPCVSKPNFVDESSNIFNPPPQPPIYSCEFCGSNAQYGHYCTPQDALGTKQYKPEDIQELFRQLLNDVQNIHEELAEYINTPGWNRPAFYDDDDDDDMDYTIAITPVLSTEEPVDSLSMEDKHLDTIPATESDEVIKFSVEDLVPIPSEFEGIPDTMCNVHLVNNPTPLEAKDHFEIVINFNDDISSSDDDSLYNENIKRQRLLSWKLKRLRTIIFVKKLLNVRHLIANIEALKDNPAPSSEFLTKSSSISPKSFLEETNTFHNSLPEFENFYFDLGEISSGSTTTHSYVSLSEYDLFIFDLANDQFPPTDRSDLTDEEFVDELAHIISPPEYDCFYFRNWLDPSELMSILNFRIRENLSSTTCLNLPIEDDHSPLLAYVVWIFLAYLTYPVIPPYLHPFENEDTIFDPGITINHFCSFKPGLSHRCGAFKKFNTHRSHLNEFLMIINGKNTSILNVHLFHFYPP
nr:hypothetical protein [Tanacetum cinerariifolium]